MAQKKAQDQLRNLVEEKNTQKINFANKITIIIMMEKPSINSWEKIHHDIGQQENNFEKLTMANVGTKSTSTLQSL